MVEIVLWSQTEGNKNRAQEFREQVSALLSETNWFCCLRRGDGEAEAGEGPDSRSRTEAGGDGRTAGRRRCNGREVCRTETGRISQQLFNNFI